MNQNGQVFTHIPRIEDLPYYYSPPMQFTFTQSAALTFGQYPFLPVKSTLGNNKNITDNTLLYIKSISFSADIPLLDYQGALKLSTGLTDIPGFSMFLQSEGGGAPVFIDPIQLGDYFNDQEYKKLILAKQLPNRISGFFEGTLQQTANLAGILEINLTMNIWVQSITDDDFIEALRTRYPVISSQ